MYIDISKEKLLPLLEEDIKKQMKEVAKATKEDITVEKIEWNEKGLRIWIQSMS